MGKVSVKRKKKNFCGKTSLYEAIIFSDGKNCEKKKFLCLYKTIIFSDGRKNCEVLRGKNFSGVVTF